MFYLVQSNHLESLFRRMMEILVHPLADPLVPETIVVQNQGMARWLSQRMAIHAGIAANVDFPLPARFIWRIFAGQLDVPENQKAFDRGIMHWRLLQLLTGPAAGPAAGQDGGAPAAYLRDDPDGRKAFHLAARIADLFDRYLIYRPDMLLAWEGTGDADWQAVLWRRLAAAGPPHRAELLRRFREKCREGLLAPEALPERVCVFGVSTLAPVYLEILHAVSRSTDVHLFHLNPCRHYWADLASGTEMARRRRTWRRKKQADVSGYFETGNALLASCGGAGREFFRLLSGLEAIGEECYVEPEGTGLLASLQRDLLDLVNRTDPGVEKTVVADEDCSVQFHSCSSPLREVQVLYDRLLGLFASDPTLEPRDILVMAPDIEAYAYAVRAVFDCAPRERFIPWALADRPMLREQTAAAFGSLLELSGGRGTAPEVTAFLEFGPVLRKWGMDGEGLATVRRWIRDGNIRWGFDRRHRQEHGQEMSELHTWSFGLKRLLLGYFGGGDGPVFRDMVPCRSLAAEEAVLLGRFVEFLESLHRCCRKLREEQPPAQWGEVLFEALDLFFAPGDDEEEQQLTALREAICRLTDHCREAGFSGPLNPAVIREYFRQELSAPSGGHSFLTGRVTFCNMVPMRSIPFRVICLLGMNDTDYPRRQETVSFDRMAAEPMPGDRDRRQDDLYLFLEAILSARSVFYVSWIGRDQVDNSLRLPSVVVSGLIDLIRRGCRPAAGGAGLPRIAEHPLQPFSSRCFDGSTGWSSYAREWLPFAGDSGKDQFFSSLLPEPEEEWRTVDIRQLQRFWSHPVRFLLRERLGLGLREDEADLPENEPFVIGGLERYQMAAALLRERLFREEGENPFHRLRLSGELPHGAFGVNVCRELDSAAAMMEARLAPLLSAPRPPREVDIEVAGFRLTGWLDGIYAWGCVRFRPAALKGRDLLRLWIEHLVLLAQDDGGEMQRSCHVAADTAAVLGRVEDPRFELRRLLELYWRGLREPLLFFPETSLAWCRAAEAGKDVEAERCWNGGFRKKGEGDDPAYRIALRGRIPLDPVFRELAAAVYAPLLQTMDSDAAV